MSSTHANSHSCFIPPPHSSWNLECREMWNVAGLHCTCISPWYELHVESPHPINQSIPPVHNPSYISRCVGVTTSSPDFQQKVQLIVPVPRFPVALVIPSPLSAVPSSDLRKEEAFAFHKHPPQRSPTNRKWLLILKPNAKGPVLDLKAPFARSVLNQDSHIFYSQSKSE